MNITYNFKVKGYLTMMDLDAGDCFTFLDDNTVYLMTYENYIVDLVTGSLYSYEEDDPRPVKKMFVDATVSELPQPKKEEVNEWEVEEEE